MRLNHIFRQIVVIGSLLALPLTARSSECTTVRVSGLPEISVSTPGSSSGEYGVSGAFVGISGNSVIVAGGSDFRGLKPWEGGVKQYYDSIYIISKDASGKFSCSLAEQRMPVAIGNGTAVSDGKTLYCFGGTDGAVRNTSVYSISLEGAALHIDTVASLPADFIPEAAALHGGAVYIHGTKGGHNALFSFIPSSGQWKELAACPDRTIEEGAPFIYQHNGREEAIYLIGGRGTDEGGLYLSSSIWEYLPVHDKWNKKTDIVLDGNVSSLMYSGAVRYGSAHILVFGGDDGKEFSRRLAMEHELKSGNADANLKEDLLESYVAHTGFSNKIFAYHTITDTWIELDESEIPFPVVTSAVVLDGDIIIPSGEKRPGVRSSDILKISVSDNVTFGWINYAVVIIYLLGMMAVGFYFSRKAKNTEQFFKGGSKIPWWAAGISIFATALSAITFLSIPAKAYMADWGMFMFNMAILLIVPIVIHFYLPFFRKLNVASAYQYLEERFSSPVRYLASLFFCLFMFARVAIVLFLPSLALNAVTGLNVYLCILLMGLVTMAYCTMGGIEAVVWGDVIQGIILVGGAIISLVFLIAGVDGGLGTVMQVAVDEQKFNILDFSLDWTKPVFWVTLLGGVANQLLTYTSDQSVVQRYITVKDTAGTKKSLWLNGLLSVPIAIIFFSIGTGLFVFFKMHPELLNVGMNNTDSIFPHFIMCDLPVGIAGLLIAAIFAAAMSTLSANINSTSTVMTEDFYVKMRKGASDKSKMRFARWTGVVIGTFGIIMAVMLATFDIVSLWDQFNFFLGLLTSGLGGLFMMGIFTKRIGTRSAFTGFAGSIVVLLLCNGYSNVSVVLYGFIGLVSCFVIGYLSSFMYGYGK